MDVVTKKTRGRWNSLESVTRLSWNGSAFLGGIIVDRYGYRVTFILTATLYIISSFPIVALLLMRIDRLLAKSQPTANNILN